MSYFVTSCGEVISPRVGIMKGDLNSTGYRRVVLNGKKYFVHRLVALYYIDNPDNLPFVNHIDGDITNNNVDNLEWCTASYNVNDGWRRGRRNPNRFSAEFEQEVVRLYKELGQFKRVAKQLGIHRDTVSGIVKRNV